MSINVPNNQFDFGNYGFNPEKLPTDNLKIQKDNIGLIFDNTEKFSRESLQETFEKPILTQTEVLNNLRAEYTNAQKSFKKQLDKDGWAAKTADAVSILWNSKNRETLVEEDLKAFKNILSDLEKSLKKGEGAFKEKFKSVFGVRYNPTAISTYYSNPTEENYKRAYGNKVGNIGTRVAVYNKSQDDGAEAVKTTAVVTGSVTAGILTGGASLLGTAAIAAGSTAVGRVVVETTDLASNNIDGDLNSESMAKIGKQAVIEGAVSGVITGGVNYAAGSIVNKYTGPVVQAVAGVSDDAAVITAKAFGFDFFGSNSETK